MELKARIVHCLFAGVLELKKKKELWCVCYISVQYLPPLLLFSNFMLNLFLSLMSINVFKDVEHPSDLSK